MIAFRRSWRRYLLAATLGPLILALPDNMSGQPVASADAVCDVALADAARYGRIDGVTRSEMADVAAIARWQETRLEDLNWTSPLRDISPTRKWAVCLYRGLFVTPTGPAPDGSPMPPHDMLRVLVTETGEVILESAGYVGHMSPETPADLAN
jgi:hypothetical protein